MTGPGNRRGAGSLVDILDRGMAVRNNLGAALLASDGVDSSHANDNETIVIRVDDRSLPFHPPAGFWGKRVSAEQLFADLIDAAQDEILLLSHDLNPEFYRDPVIVGALRRAAESGVVIWIVVREPKDWAWLDNHPLATAFSDFEDNGVYLRVFTPAAKDAERNCADFMVIDRTYFRWEPDCLLAHAFAARDGALSCALRDSFIRLWQDDTDNLSGDCGVPVHFVACEADGQGSPTHFRCSEHPLVSVEYTSGNPESARPSLERVTATAMGVHFSRRDMAYSAEFTDGGAVLRPIRRGVVRHCPEARPAK